MERVSFIEMKTGTAEEFQMLAARDEEFAHTLPDRVLQIIKMQEMDDGGYQINRLQHVLQTATRAYRDGASDEWIVAALAHDMGDIIAPDNHASVAAEILKPFVSEEIYWVVKHHGIFQGVFFWHHIGRDQHAREKYRGHPYFESCERFCEQWDQNSFDPNYDTLPLEFFEPIVQRVFRKNPYQ